MTDAQISAYREKGWKLTRSKQPDPQSGENRVCDSGESPRTKFWCDLNDTETEMLDDENREYARKLFDANYVDVEDRVRKLTRGGIKAKKVVVTVTLA